MSNKPFVTSQNTPKKQATITHEEINKLRELAGLDPMYAGSRAINLSNTVLIENILAVLYHVAEKQAKGKK